MPRKLDLSHLFTLGLFFERIESNLPIGSGLDRVNSAQVGGAIQSKEHSELLLTGSVWQNQLYPLRKIGPQLPLFIGTTLLRNKLPGTLQWIVIDLNNRAIYINHTSL